MYGLAQSYIRNKGAIINCLNRFCLSVCVLGQMYICTASVRIKQSLKKRSLTRGVGTQEEYEWEKGEA